MKATNEIRIYVACLKAYNNGKLHGEWIDATQDADDIQSDANKMLEVSPEHTEDEPCEEWAIHDYEGFGSIKLSEYTDFEEVAKIAKAIEQHGEAFTIYASDVGLEHAIENFEEAYCGEWKSEEDYAENLVEDTGMLSECPESMKSYFDYEKFARDLFMCDYWYDNGHVFRRDI
jgi:antirestriction protein